jgi:hypothetical protein
MRLRHVIPFSLVCLLLWSSITYPEISQYFDSEGKFLSAESRNKADNTSDSMQRYTIPEGVVLQKNIRYEFYPVFGRTFSEIVRSAEENSPLEGKNQNRLPAKTDWTAGWSYKIDYAEEFDDEEKTVRVLPEIYGISIMYDITITLPTLIDDTALNPEEKILWKNYFVRLLEYEHDHARIVRDKDAQEELREKFMDLDKVIFVFGGDVDIDKVLEAFMRKETRKIGREWVKKLSERIDAYEKATDYGIGVQGRESFFSPGEK